MTAGSQILHSTLTDCAWTDIKLKGHVTSGEQSLGVNRNGERFVGGSSGGGDEEDLSSIATSAVDEFVKSRVMSEDGSTSTIKQGGVRLSKTEDVDKNACTEKWLASSSTSPLQGDHAVTDSIRVQANLDVPPEIATTPRVSINEKSTGQVDTAAPITMTLPPVEAVPPQPTISPPSATKPFSSPLQPSTINVAPSGSDRVHQRHAIPVALSSSSADTEYSNAVQENVATSLSSVVKQDGLSASLLDPSQKFSLETGRVGTTAAAQPSLLSTSAFTTTEDGRPARSEEDVHNLYVSTLARIRNPRLKEAYQSSQNWQHIFLKRNFLSQCIPQGPLVVYDRVVGQGVTQRLRYRVKATINGVALHTDFTYCVRLQSCPLSKTSSSFGLNIMGISKVLRDAVTTELYSRPFHFMGSTQSMMAFFHDRLRLFPNRSLVSKIFMDITIHHSTKDTYKLVEQKS
ncbi:hypothetical protein EJ08DRAFT_54767 [Tothia fuscella]|uniref:Uncharacterized protein n=1 Tax=Tothia fuscella TaxID=1048955 RepID=A0A9P4U170_9PEZI|nr:hypothetical protein EJ08DRAFT_54767 [Tothia fuscella]